MIGLLIGAVFGALQFLILSRFTASITGGTPGIRSVLFGVSQFFLPFAALLCCALLFPKGLVWSGIGMAAALVVCAIVSFASRLKKIVSR